LTGHRPRLLELLRERSFARRKVVLASGKESDWFIDCKQTALTAEGHALSGALLFEAIEELVGRDPDTRPQAVAGVVLGGCPLASAVAMVAYEKKRPLDALYVRKETKDHGTKRLIEGAEHLPRGARVVLTEDVITTAGSTLAAVDVLEAAGFAIAGIVALVDRGEGGREALAARALPFRALYTRDDFFRE
jgi:orotate phosphoribosyltransferase